MSNNFDSQKVLTHLKEKWKGKSCPMCEIGNWNVSDNIFELRKFHGGNLVVSNTPIVPLVPVTCDNCGNTILVNAVKIGLIKPSNKQDNEQ